MTYTLIPAADARPLPPRLLSLARLSVIAAEALTVFPILTVMGLMWAFVAVLAGWMVVGDE